MKVLYTMTAMLLVAFFSINTSKAQLSEEAEKLTPDFPGEIRIDLGFNALHKDEASSWWRSRSFGVYFVKTYELTDRIEFRPSIGWGSEKLAPKKRLLNDYDSVFMNDESLVINTPDTTRLLKMTYAINYIDLPLTFRYSFKGHKQGGMFLELGGQAGLRVESHGKIKYETPNGKRTTLKARSQSLNVSDVRYGVQGRFGIGAFSVFYKHYFSKLGTDFLLHDQEYNMSTIGISLSGF